MFVVQSGIAAWEDPKLVADWKWKTLSIVSKKLSAAVALMWVVVASRPPRFTRVLRLYLAPFLPSVTDAQKRRFLAELKVDPEGFSETALTIADTHVCVTSVLSDPSAVDAGLLTAYRRCILVEVDDSWAKSNSIGDTCGTITEFGSHGIGALLAGEVSLAVVRLLELESYVVIQLIGGPEVADLAVEYLAERGARQFHDIRTLPQEIATLGQ